MQQSPNIFGDCPHFFKGVGDRESRATQGIEGIVPKIPTDYTIDANKQQWQQ